MKSVFTINQELIEKKIYILGTDLQAKLFFSALLQHNLYISGFINVDKRTACSKLMNKPVVDKEFIEKEKNAIVVVASGENWLGVAEELEKEGFTVYYDFIWSSYNGDSVLI